MQNFSPFVNFLRSLSKKPQLLKFDGAMVLWRETSNRSISGPSYTIPIPLIILLHLIKLWGNRYGSNAVLKAETTYLPNNDNVIETKASTKDLGVIMSSTADFKDHNSSDIYSKRLIILDTKILPLT